MKIKNVLQALGRLFRSTVAASVYQHNPMLINSLVDFNFRPPLMLIFPGEEFRNYRRSPRKFSSW